MTKSNNLQKVEEFRAQIQPVLKQLELAKTPWGFLRLLSALLKRIKSIDMSCAIYTSWLRTIEENDQRLWACKERLTAWMMDKLAVMKQVCDDVHVEEKIRQAELSLEGRSGEIVLNGSFFGLACRNFEFACHTVAYFGERSVLKEWITIVPRKTCFPFLKVEFPDFYHGERIEAGSEKGKKIIKRLKQGFIFVEVCRSFSPEEIYLDVVQGTVEQIQYPEEDYRLWRQSENSFEGQVSEDCSPEANFNFLRLLAVYAEYHSDLKTDSGGVAKNLMIAEQLSHAMILRLFGGKFKTKDWQKAFMSRGELLERVQRLIAFMEDAIIFSIEDPHEQDNISLEHADTALTVAPKKSKKVHGRTLQAQDDWSRLRPLGKEAWRARVVKHSVQELRDISQEIIAEEIKGLAKARKITLSLDVPARYAKIAKETDPRLWENGVFQGLKPGYHA